MLLSIGAAGSGFFANGAVYVFMTDRAKQPQVVAFILIVSLLAFASCVGGIIWKAEQHRKGGVL
jgi:hypothetical protein